MHAVNSQTQNIEHAEQEIKMSPLTNFARHDRLVIDVGLNPRHQLLYIGRCGHLGWSLVVFAVLPEIFKPIVVNSLLGAAVAGWDIYLTHR